MKGKNLSKMTAIDIGLGIVDGFGGMLYDNTYENRLVKNTKLENCTVDTAFTPDTNYFETAIAPNYLAWIIVDEYATKDEAIKGHDKWVKYMKKKPKKLWGIRLERYIKI